MLNFFNYYQILFGDWGLGIGPNPQSPIPNPQLNIIMNKKLYEIISKIFNNNLIIT